MAEFVMSLRLLLPVHNQAALFGRGPRNGRFSLEIGFYVAIGG
jgi:hypothetical protein